MCLTPGVCHLVKRGREQGAKCSYLGEHQQQRNVKERHLSSDPQAQGSLPRKTLEPTVERCMPRLIKEAVVPMVGVEDIAGRSNMQKQGNLRQVDLGTMRDLF